MNTEKMGRFIAERRKDKHMTQKDFARMLNITDKAVSKWERGISCPDISLLPSVADILGVTIHELLNGEQSNTEAEGPAAGRENALQYADSESLFVLRNLVSPATRGSCSSSSVKYLSAHSISPFE